MTRSLFIDLHALQPVPFANLNRDELGSPKSVFYGGKDRTRISSQSWKRVIRHDVEEQIGEYAARTRMIPGEVRRGLQARGWPEELASYAGEQVIRDSPLGLHEEDPGLTSVLLYVPAVARDELIALCVAHRAELEAGQAAAAAADAAKGSPRKRGAKTTKADPILPGAQILAILKARTASIDMFGRMIAEIPGAKVDGAVQVAHPFTTHASDPQADFFTAVDDWRGEAETGSGHMQTQDFSAGVFYRYATVNVTDLTTNLGGDHVRAQELVRHFADAFLYSLPQAKRNSTAPHTVPAFAYFAVHSGRPLSLAGAFEAPVRAQFNGYLTPSIKALADHAGDLRRITNNRGLVSHAHASIEDKPHEPLGELLPSFDNLIDQTANAAFSSTTAHR